LLLVNNVWLILAVLALTHLLLLSAGIDRARLGWVWRMMAPTIVTITVLWIILYPGEGPTLLDWWFLRITPASLAQGLAIGLRLAALAFVLFVWLFTTDQATLVRSLVALGLPYQWGLVLAMALRYLPTMGSLFRMISDAQQARGLDLARGGPLRRARAYLPITVAMLIAALRTAESLSYTLESRALGARPHRTFLRELTFGPWDAAWVIAVVLVTATILWARLALGFGVHPLQLW
jgi:energy-coupling factor transport system permease protein